METVKENKEANEYIQRLGQKANQAWQVEVCESLQEMVLETIPAAEERLQYGKPHYLKNGHYAAVISASKDKVSFMIFNAGGIVPVEGVLRSMGNGERKTADIRKGEKVDYGQLSAWLKETSSAL